MALLQFGLSQGSERSVESRQEAKESGVKGEQMATRYLEEQEYVILERNYRKGHKEVDIIALDHDEIVFVEVKSRSSDPLVSPEQAVDHKKRQNLIRVANNYVRSNNRTEPVRFDIVAITGTGTDAKITHIKNAFNVMCF